MAGHIGGDGEGKGEKKLINKRGEKNVSYPLFYGSRQRIKTLRYTNIALKSSYTIPTIGVTFKRSYTC